MDLLRSFFSSDVADDVPEQEANELITKCDLLADLFDSCGGKFDPLLHLACLQYLRQHEIEHRVTKKTFTQCDIDDDEWSITPFRDRVTLVFESPVRTRIGKAMLALQAVLVFTTLVAILLESMPEYSPDIHSSQKDLWNSLDGIIAAYFLGELVIRMVCFRPPRKKFLFRFAVILDLLSVLPFFVEVIFQPTSRSWLGMLKAARIVRLSKLTIHIRPFETLLLAMRKSVHSLLSPLLFLTVTGFVLSAALYYAERGSFDKLREMFYLYPPTCTESLPAVVGRITCAKEESEFHSILGSIWVIITTMTSTGYGDIVAKTSIGMVVSWIAMIIGSLFLAMPIAIVGSFYTMIVNESNMIAKKLRHGRRLSSFIRRRPTDGSASELRSKAAEPAPNGDRGDISSSGEKLINFLKANCSKQDLAKVKLTKPKTVVLFYTDLFLSDFADELLNLGSRRTTKESRCVAELRPVSSSWAVPVFSLGLVKNTKFELLRYRKFLTEKRMKKEIQDLVEREATSALNSVEQIQLDIARTEGTVESVVHFTSRQLGVLKLIYDIEEDDVHSAFTTGSHHTPLPSVNYIDDPTARQSLLLSGGDEFSQAMQRPEIENSKWARRISTTAPLVFLSLADPYTAVAEERDCAYFLTGERRSRNAGSAVSASEGRTIRMKESDAMNNEQFFSRPKRIYPEGLVDLPVHSSVLAKQEKIITQRLQESVGAAATTTSMKWLPMDAAVRVDPITGAKYVQQALPLNPADDDSSSGDEGGDERKKAPATTSGMGLADLPKDIGDDDCVSYVYYCDDADMHRIYSAFKCAMVARKRTQSASNLNAAAVGVELQGSVVSELFQSERELLDLQGEKLMNQSVAETPSRGGLASTKRKPMRKKFSTLHTL